MPLRLLWRKGFLRVMEVKMSASLENKKQVVESIKAKISESKSVVLIDYKGLTVAQDTELRNEFRKAGVEYKVLKNTLVRKAFNELGVNDFDSDLNGPTAVAFGVDEITPAKIVMAQIKKLEEKISVKSGYVDGNRVDVNGVKSLASMPSKEEMIAKMLGSMQAPITNFAGVLSGIMRSVVIALNAVAEKKA